MARETKYALLIGLAFIVAFGFVLAQQDESARTQHEQRVPPPPQPVVGDMTDPAPAGSVWSRGDGEDRLVQALQLGHDGSVAPVTPPVAEQTAPAGEPEAINIIGIAEPPAGGAVGGPAVGGPGGVQPVPGPGPTPPAPPQRWYTVEQGDNLTRIARKFYGESNGGKWRLILEANPTRIPSAEGLRPRVRIIIPPLPGEPVSAGAPAGGVTPGPAPGVVPVPSGPAPAAVAVRTYEVKVGDTLSGIAAQFLGSSGRYQQIVDWNRDQIQDANSIRVGMKLKVGPAPAAASPPVAVPPPSPVPDMSMIVGHAPADVLEIPLGPTAAVPTPASTGVTVDALRHLADAAAVTPVAPTPRPTAPAAPAAPQAVYEVQTGDTLSGIASAKLGSSGRWQELLSWNRDVISDPSYLRPGMKLRLSPPAGLTDPAAGGTFTSAPPAAEEVGETVG